MRHKRPNFSSYKYEHGMWLYRVFYANRDPTANRCYKAKPMNINNCVSILAIKEIMVISKIFSKILPKR